MEDNRSFKPVGCRSVRSVHSFIQPLFHSLSDVTKDNVYFSEEDKYECQNRMEEVGLTVFILLKSTSPTGQWTRF